MRSMKFINTAIVFLLFSIVSHPVLLAGENRAASKSAETAQSAETEHGADAGMPLATVSEARFRAKLLHETIRGTLQVMHRDFFDEDNAHAIPSASLEDVFDELLLAYDTEVKWLVVNTDVVNVDHKPVDAFERQAAKVLAAGKKSFETTETNADSGQSRFRYAGPIHLRSQCLKCHVKRRISNEDRVAGLTISMPVKLDSVPTKQGK